VVLGTVPQLVSVANAQDLVCDSVEIK
jgi:hypothetical protein